ncbi:hypothetical protein KAH37_09325 [bacterium]|nr:hypothetical protein [bacterium]
MFSMFRKTLLLWLVAIALTATGCQLKPGDTAAGDAVDQTMVEGATAPLKNLTVGIPAKKGIESVRTAFSPTEKQILQALWHPQAADYTANFIWHDPSGKVVYKKDNFTMEKQWTRALIHYKGPTPMKAGKWSIVVQKNGKSLGKVSFNVIRDKSKVPLLAQVKAFKSNKMNTTEVAPIMEAFTEFLAGTLTEEKVLADIPAILAKRKLSLAMDIYRNNKQVAILFGSGETLKESIKQLLSRMKAYKGTKADISLSVIHMSAPIPRNPFSVHKKFMKYMGFSLKKGEKSAILLPSTMNFKNMQEGVAILRQLCTDASLPENCWESGNVELTAFKAQEFVRLSGDETVREFAYNREGIPLNTVTRADILKAIKASGDYYIDNQHKDGHYLYMYYPGKGEDPGDAWCLRDLNAVYVYAKIAADNKDAKLMASVKKNIALYRSAIVHQTVNGIDYDFVKWEQPRKDSSVASSAFLLGAMLHVNDPAYKSDMKKLSDSILKLQNPDGMWRTDFIKPLREIDQLFFPGETMLAMMEYYKYSGDKKIKAAVAKAFPYYVNFWKNKKEGPFVPWQIRAYAQMYDVDPQKKYADFVFDLADWMLNKFTPLTMDVGYGRAGALNRMYASTGVYMEGLATAYDVAVKAKDAKRAEKYARAIHGGSGYALGLQWKEADGFRYPKPKVILGGLVMKPFNSEMRLDSTYHSVSALQITYNLFTDQQWSDLTKRIYGSQK